FHTSSNLRSDASSPNHYDALQLGPTASAAEIKRQFYSLSKTHHPDRNPNDPTATTRFVAISEAYHTLSVPEKRAQYDAQLSQAQGSKRWSNVWRGAGEQSHSQGSYSSFAGSRPASGLNKKRSTFRGPPPSFYKSGGYGRHGTKRAEYAQYQHETKAEKDADPESYGGFAGFGPGQTRHGQQVPHFNDRRHQQTHDQINEHIQARRKKTRPPERYDEDQTGQVTYFFMITGALGII
ncbi:DnaJ-domain-containing protein, partial [Periconia macrospinosa]